MEKAKAAATKTAEIMRVGNADLYDMISLPFIALP
jgi:hypothetical protein